MCYHAPVKNARLKMLNYFIQIQQEKTAKVLNITMASGQKYSFSLSSYKISFSNNNNLVIFSNDTFSIAIDPKYVETVAIS